MAPVRHTLLPQGHYTVGCVDIMCGKDKDGILLKLFYPTDLSPIQEHGSSKWTKWFMGSKYSEGLAKDKPFFLQSLFTYVGNWTADGLYIPAVWEAPIANGKFQTIVFSHGLTGNRNVYSSLLADMASHGFIVASVEHRDESASATFTLTDSKKKDWILLNTEFNKKKEYEFRNKQIKIRAAECSRCLDLLIQLNDGKSVENELKSSFELKTLGYRFNLSEPILMGQSFGGATVIQALALDGRFQLGVSLDPWLFPIKDELAQLASKIDRPILFILMELFQDRKNLDALSKFKNSTNTFVTVKDSAHINQTDAMYVTTIEPFLWILDGRSGIDRKLALKLNNHLILDFLHKNLKGTMYSLESIKKFLEKESENFTHEAIGRASKMGGWSSLTE